MKYFRNFALFVAWIASPVWAADPPLNTLHGEGLEINVIVTEKGNELFDSWDKPTGSSFNVEPVKVASRGEFLSAIILFKGCRADGVGNCNVDMDIIAFDPTGKIYGEMPRVELWQHKPAPDPGFTQLSRGFMGIVIEPTDPPGVYRVTVVARDNNAKTESKSVARFEVK